MHPALYFLVLQVSARNELLSKFNTWTTTIGSWDYSAGEFDQDYSTKTHAELIVLDTQWYNADGRLSINYSYSIDFNNGCHGSSGVTLFNGNAASYCEFYYIGIGCYNDVYNLHLSRGKAPSGKATWLEDVPLNFTYQNANEYTLSIIVHNSHIFDAYIDDIPYISYTDDDGYTCDNEYSGYISLWSLARYETTAKYLEISGIPRTVTPLVPGYDDNCVSLSPTKTTKDPTKPPVPAPFAQPTSTPQYNPSTQPTLNPTVSISTSYSNSDDNHKDYNGRIAESESFINLWIYVPGALLLLLSILVCVLCIIKRRNKSTKDVTNLKNEVNDTTENRPIGEGSPSERKCHATVQNEDVALEMVCHSDHALLDKPPPVPPVPEDSCSDEELHLLSSGNVTSGAPVVSDNSESDDDAPPPPLPPSDEYVPPPPLPPSEYEQNHKAMPLTAAFTTLK